MPEPAPDLAAEPAARFAERLAATARRVEAELGSLLAAKRRTLEAAGAGELVDALEDLVLGGGKRLRPALVLEAFRAAGGGEEAPALRLGVAVELLHAYLLIHDDIMDRAEVRRGLPSAHVRFGERHRRNGWHGDAAEFGRAMAILLGDLAHTWAVEAYASVSAGTPAGAALDRCFSAMCEEVVVGQYLEMHLPATGAGDEEELLRVLRLKSARYSVERPIELGATLAGAPARTRRGLLEYGAAVGEAFQLRDDVLGVFGDEETLGKPVGADLAAGKVTFLIHHALRRAGAAAAARLRELLGRPDLDRVGVKEARGIIRDSGGLAAVEEMIEERLAAARRALDGLSLEGETRSFFGGLIAYSTARQR